MMITMMGRSVSRRLARGGSPLDSGLIPGRLWFGEGYSLGKPRLGRCRGRGGHLAAPCPGCGRPGPGAAGRRGFRTAARLLPLKLRRIFPRKIREVFVPAGDCVPGVVALGSAVAVVLFP